MWQAAAYGRLTSDPRAIETAKGTPMTVGRIAVAVGAETDDTEFLGVVAFNRLATELGRHAKGEPLSVSGRVQARTYTDRDGNERRELQIIADAIVGPRTPRPGGRNRIGGRHDAQEVAQAREVLDGGSESTPDGGLDEAPF